MCKIATISREKMVSKLTRKLKSNNITTKVFKKNENKKERKSKKKSWNGLKNMTKRVKTFLNRLKRRNPKIVINLSSKTV